MNLYCSCGKQKDETIVTHDEWAALAFKAVEMALEAAQKFGPYASFHEAYAVLAEEVDELWQIVKQKQIPKERPAFGVARNSEEIKREALDIAAVALRIAADAERMARK